MIYRRLFLRGIPTCRYLLIWSLEIFEGTGYWNFWDLIHPLRISNEWGFEETVSSWYMELIYLLICSAEILEGIWILKFFHRTDNRIKYLCSWNSLRNISFIGLASTSNGCTNKNATLTVIQEVKLQLYIHEIYSSSVYVVEELRAKAMILKQAR